MVAGISARAAVLRASDQPFQIEDVRLEPPRADEVLVRLAATGICHTDMVMRDRLLPTPQPVVLGHEGSGVVEAVGSAVVHVVPGDHVVLTFNSCGRCSSCSSRAPAYCDEFFPRNFIGVRTDGTTPIRGQGGAIFGNIFGQSSFATHAIAHARNTVKVRPDAPLDLLGPLGCGVMTGAGAAINALQVAPGRSFAIFGAGAVGLSALMAAKAVGAGTLIAVDRNPERIRLAKALGADHAILVPADDVAGQIVDLTGGGVDFALDTTGLSAVAQTAAMALGRRGVLGLSGASPPGEVLSLDMTAIMSTGRVVRGVVEGDADPHRFIPELIELHLGGRFPFDRLVKFYPFEAINEAIADGEEGRTVKPVLRMA